MKILSDFKDYYDGGRALDDEDTPVYARFCVVHELPDVPRPEHRALIENASRDLWQRSTLPPDAPWADVEVIAFCGRLYPLYRVGWSDIKGKQQTRYCYTFDQYIRALEERHAFERTLEHSTALGGLRDALKSVQSSERPRHRFRYDEPRLNRATWAEFQASRVVDVPPRFFVYFKAPVVSYQRRKLVINPCLKDYNFVSQVAPHQAWQDLSMFLGNTLVDLAATPPRPISDELRAQTHGFDRQSFRSAKGGRVKSSRNDW